MVFNWQRGSVVLAFATASLAIASAQRPAAHNGLPPWEQPLSGDEVPRLNAHLQYGQRWLDVPFQVINGRLASLSAGSGLPQFFTLYLISPHHGTCLLNIRQLRGHVRIASPGQALAFVRLGTDAPETPRISGPSNQHALEIMARNDVTLATAYGDAHVMRLLRSMPRGDWGILPASNKPDGKRFLPLLATCTPSAGGYLIRRTLSVNAPHTDFPRSRNWPEIDLEQQRAQIYAVTERVGLDGTYQKLNAARLRGRFPYFYWSALTQE